VWHLSPTHGFYPHLTREPLSLAVFTSACTCLQLEPVGGPDGPPEEGVLQLRRPGDTEFPRCPYSCLHRSRSLRQRYPSGPPRATDTRGLVQPRPSHRRPPFPCRAGGEPSLEDCSRRSLTRFARSMISRHSMALWRPCGCTNHEPLLPFCGRGRLLRSPWPPIAAVTTRAVDRGF
jgi:hypothetical protein